MISDDVKAENALTDALDTDWIKLAKDAGWVRRVELSEPISADTYEVVVLALTHELPADTQHHTLRHTLAPDGRHVTLRLVPTPRPLYSGTSLFGRAPRAAA